jgi:hypothetical protein
MPEDEVVNLLQKISEDISTMKNFVRFQAMESISTILRRIASTPERQQMWRLADSNRNNEEIARMIGVALRSVQYFTQEAQDAGLIVMKRRGYPSRVVDIFPPEWKPWRPRSVEAGQQKTGQEPIVKEGGPDV